MKVQIKRGLEADRNNIVPEEGEFVFTTDGKKVFIGDGNTTGGVSVGGDFVLEGYTKPSSATPIVPTDNVTKAIGKLDKTVDALLAGSGSIQSDWNGTDVASGKILNQPDLINDLTSGGATKILSAEQGKALKALLDAVNLATANYLLKDGSVKLDSSFAPHLDNDIATVKFVKNSTEGHMVQGNVPITDVVTDITKVGIYHGGVTNPADSSKNVNVANTPTSVTGQCMIMASNDPHGNFGYFCMGDDMILYTGARPSGGTSIAWSSSKLGTGKTVLLDAYAKPATTGSIGSTDSIQSAIGKLEKGMEHATAGGGEDNVNADWGESDVNNDAFIKNKPNIQPTFAVIDNLTTTDADKALSANQGTILKGLVDANTVKVGITPAQVTAIAGNTAKESNIQSDWSGADAAHGKILNRPDLSVIDGGSF